MQQGRVIIQVLLLVPNFNNYMMPQEKMDYKQGEHSLITTISLDA